VADYNQAPLVSGNDQPVVRKYNQLDAKRVLAEDAIGERAWCVATRNDISS
jgi:hypothetical protein